MGNGEILQSAGHSGGMGTREILQSALRIPVEWKTGRFFNPLPHSGGMRTGEILQSVAYPGGMENGEILQSASTFRRNANWGDSSIRFADFRMTGAPVGEVAPARRFAAKPSILRIGKQEFLDFRCFDGCFSLTSVFRCAVSVYCHLACVYCRVVSVYCHLGCVFRCAASVYCHLGCVYCRVVSVY